jgi:hypothetical protein
MSPLALPRDLLDSRVKVLADRTQGALRDLLLQLTRRPTFQEQWPDQWEQGLRRGKQRVLKLEHIRSDRFTMNDILQQDSELYEWWQNIRTD